MRPKIVLRYVGLTLAIDGVFLLASAAVSLGYHDAGFFPLLYSALLAILVGAFPVLFVRGASKISPGEGLMIVVVGWLVSCLAGTVPYVLWGGEFTFTNAWFESVSGFTTTGSSILTNIEAVPKGLLFWRALTHWIGGVGILVFVLSVLPSMGMSSTVVARAEISPLAQEGFRQNTRNILRILMTVYVALTALETIALLVAGMGLYDAVTHSFATIATGGFSPRNTSVAYYHSVAVEAIIIVFMVFSGAHFGLIYSAVVQGRPTLWKSTAFRYYVTAMVVGTGIVALTTHGSSYDSWGAAFRYAAFQVASVGTSTGFANADSSVWAPVAQIVLMLFALQCACVGSTSGGIKTDRIVLVWKAIARQLRRLQHPQAVVRAWVDGKSVDDETLSASVLYVVVYLVVVALGGTILTALGVDALSAFSGTIATTGNVGPGLGSVGSTGNFAHIPSVGKWVLSATMLLGRLEVYGLIMIFMPAVRQSRAFETPRP